MTAYDQDSLYRRIGHLNAAYAHAIDDNMLESWPDFFTEECFYVVTNSDNHRQGLQAGLIYADSKGMLRDRVAALRDANIYEHQTYRHVVSQPSVETGQDGDLRADTGFLVARVMRTGQTELFATGRYLDRFVIDDQRLLLRERIVVCDSRAIDTLLAIPL